MPTVRQNPHRGARRRSSRHSSYQTYVRLLTATVVSLTAAIALRADEPLSSPPASPPVVIETPGAPKPIVSIGPGNKVTMHLSGVPLADALRMLSEPTRRNIILANGANGTVSCSLYNVTFEQALDAMLVSNGMGYRIEGEFIYVHPAEEIQKIAKSRRVLTARVFRLTYVNAATAKDLIAPLLTPEVGKISLTPPASKGLGGGNSTAGSSGTGSGSNGPETQGDALASSDAILVTDYADVLDKIGRVLSDLDSRPKQVLVEATIMRATLNEDNALGIDFTTVGGVDFGALASTSPGAQSITTGNVATPDLQNTAFTVRTNLNQSVPNGGFTFGIIKDQVGVFIRALESITDTNVLANPKILALNKQIGQVVVGRRDGYLTTTITETTAVQQVQFLETGTVLTFRPFIGDDGTVRMEIHPKDSTGGLTSSDLPFEQTTEVTTNVLVKDGNTILIGGLFREVSTSTRGQVPGLGNLPGIGALFRTTRDTTVREEVIILLTVHIVKGDADQAANRELYEDTERFRVGMRRGMQWYGRERLAEAHYQQAVQDLAAGHVDRALFNAELAMHNYPRHAPAAKLAEKIRRSRTWECEASSVRSFVNDRIAEESGVISKPFDRPMPPYVLPDEREETSGISDDALDSEIDAAIKSGLERQSKSKSTPAPGTPAPTVKPAPIGTPAPKVKPAPANDQLERRS